MDALPAAADAALPPAALDALGLGFDREAMLARLREWAECESPTHDAAAVERMMDLAARDLALMGASVDRIPGRMGFAGCVRARLPHPAMGAVPGVLVLAHLDTVHPVGTLAGGLAFRRDGDRVYGPGVCDMKGGTLVAFEAMRAMLRAGVPLARPVTVLLTGDEEVGSPSTRDLIEAEAARHAAVLVPEPARPDGGVVTGRYAIARFAMSATGRPSHAGATPGEGRSAIREMCRAVLAAEALATEDCTVSVGVISGGAWANCVPTRCEAQALSMAKRQADLDAGVARMLALSSGTPGVTLEVRRGVTRPVWEPGAGTIALYGKARALAARLGVALGHGSAGGGSDGNFTGAMGVPTLDGLGVVGAGYHTLEEHLRADSLVPRARLMAGLLASV